jgi:plasmid stabilization system protein ParE
MPHKIRLSDEALRQITAIGDYIAKDSSDNARRWIIRLRAAIDTLCTFPKRHAVLYTAAEAGREVRQTFYGVYRILYEIQDDTVYVLTVRHGAQRPIGPAEIEGIE